MNDSKIREKITELRQLLEHELPNTTTSFTLTITADETNWQSVNKDPVLLKRAGVSMRNIRGEFIK